MLLTASTPTVLQTTGILGGSQRGCGDV